MAFNPKNPFISPKAITTPPTPMPGTEGLFPMNDGWYRIDENGNTYKFVTDSNYVHTDNNYTNEERKIAGLLSDKNFFVFSFIDINQFGIYSSQDVGFISLLSNEKYAYTYDIGNIVYINELTEGVLRVSNKYDDLVGDGTSLLTKDRLLSEIESTGEVRVGHYGFQLIQPDIDYQQYALLINTIHYNIVYTEVEKNKLSGIAKNAQVNRIESIKVNGEALKINEKSVDIEVPTKITELENDANFISDENYVHTDNNFSDVYKDKIESNSQDIFGAINLGNTAIQIAQGANRATSFGNYAEMVEWFNYNPNWGADSDVIFDYQIGQNIMIGTVNVPDLWIAELPYNEGYTEYTYTTDEAFVEDLKQSLENNIFLRVGYVALGALETQKVDLTEYPDREEMNEVVDKAIKEIEIPSVDLTSYSTTEQMNTAIQTAIGDVLGGAS